MSQSKSSAPYLPDSADFIRTPSFTAIILGMIMLVSLCINIWGIRKDLPFAPDEDEHVIIKPAVKIAAKHNLNPKWFGHPGSTIIYPLALLYKIEDSLSYEGDFFHKNKKIKERFDHDIGTFHMTGRALAISYNVLSLIFIFLIGRLCFGTRIGLLGCVFYALYPIIVYHAQLTRTDTAAVFFGTLSIWSILKLYKEPSWTNQILAGCAVGLSIATRYFMVALIPVLFLMELYLIWQVDDDSHRRRSMIVQTIMAIGAVLIAFAVITPYFFLDFTTAWNDIIAEAQDTHLGADGLSPFQNFAWYITVAVPKSITWPQMLLAGVGIGFGLWKRRLYSLFLLIFLAIFMLGICLSPLHWDRWIIQLLPIFAIFCAYGLTEIISLSMGQFTLKHIPELAIIVFAVLLLITHPTYDTVLRNLGESQYSTQITAREWLIANIPDGSKIVKEWYTAPLQNTSFVEDTRFSLATDMTIEEYKRKGYQYLIVSSYMYDRYFKEPERYSHEVSFYEYLFKNGVLLKDIVRSKYQAGPEVKVFQLKK